MKVIRYEKKYFDEWNAFLLNAKNQTFLFNRNFMDYHSDRFIDHSLMVYDEKGNLICCFPANEKSARVVSSHSGLTYGSFILKNDIKLPIVLEVVKAILKYYQKQGFESIEYKAFPRIYNIRPADEIEYVLSILGADLFRRDSAIVINQKDRIKYSGNIRREAKKAKGFGAYIEESDDFTSFWEDVLIPNLNKRFGVDPVHSVDEILLLESNFPQNIKLFEVKNIGGDVLAGTVFFITDNVAHCQYIASTDEGRYSGALNYLFTYLIDEVLNDRTYFDFGIVNEKDGLKLNKGMLAWKERMGGRTISHDFYKIKIDNWIKIDQLINND